MTMDRFGSFCVERARDLFPYEVDHDPNAISSASLAFNESSNKSYKARRWHPTPTVITPTTPAPANLSQAMRYPDRDDWARAHDKELDKIDDMKTTNCISPDFIPPSKPLPITIAYRYKWTTGLQLLQQKERGALRGDLMIPFVHYDPSQLAAPMASSYTVRLLFSLKTKMWLKMEHFDITSAFLHEVFGYKNGLCQRNAP